MYNLYTFTQPWILPILICLNISLESLLNLNPYPFNPYPFILFPLNFNPYPFILFPLNLNPYAFNPYPIYINVSPGFCPY
jgi:hypothetical protein